MGVGWTGWRLLSLLNSHGSGLSGQLYKVQCIPKTASCLDSLFSSGGSSLGPGVARSPEDQPSPPCRLVAVLVLTDCPLPVPQLSALCLFSPQLLLVLF